MGSSSRTKIIKTNEAPYQIIGKRTLATTLGYKELYYGHFWLSLLSECISCYLYVFIVCSTRISWTGAIIGHEPNLMAMSLSSGIAMMLLIFTFRTVHVNPALTISFLLTGRIPIIRALLYLIAHCLGSIAAIAFLYSITIKGHNGALGLDNPHEALSSWQILIVEAVITFVIALATYATCNYSSYEDAKKSVLDQLTTSSLLEPSSLPCDNTIQSQRAYHSRGSVAPIVPQIPSTSITLLEQPATFRSNPQAGKGSLLNFYNVEDNNHHENEYDNHRIYATQQHQRRLQPDESPSNQVPIEEVMQDECQLLAPNGFSLHVTSGQAFVIGLAYTLTSLSGIPASGGSLNPARSFGPAFIMNQWDRHWIYWLGPILGAVIAGFCYEFIFNPTRKSSLCYRPKLFRFSAQDMAEVGSKSRLYQQQQQQHQPHQPHQQHQQHQQYQHQQQQQKLFPTASASTIYRPQIHNQPIIHHSTLTRPLYRPCLRSSLITSDNGPIRKNHLQTGGTDNREQVFYDNPKLEDLHEKFRVNQRSFGRPLSSGLHTNAQQRFDWTGVPSDGHPQGSAIFNGRTQQQYVNDGQPGSKPQFNSIHHLVSPRPHSFASIDQNQRQAYLTDRHFNNNNNTGSDCLQTRKNEEDCDELLDEDLYHVLSEAHQQHLSPENLEGDISCFQMNKTSDSSQRTSEMLAQSASDSSGSNSNAGGLSRSFNERSAIGNHLMAPQNGTQIILNSRDFDDTYYN